MSTRAVAVEAEGLRALNDSFSTSRRARPSTMDFSTVNEDGRLPLKEAKLVRQSSKGGLRGIFTRTRAERPLIAPLAEEESTFTPAGSHRSVREVASERKVLQNSQEDRSSTMLKANSSVPTTPSKPITRHSMMHLRSTKQAKSEPKPAIKSSPKSSSKQPTRTSTTWDPPPLFQAYPQSIKHATLTASSLSADSILRLSSSNERTGSKIDELVFGKQEDSVPGAATKKSEKAKSKHRRQISGSLLGGTWTQKIFVLVCVSPA
jgi:hypothetical protein